MRKTSLLFGLALAMTLLLNAFASADRVPMRRVGRIRSNGTRVSIRVPYLTNGSSSFGVWHGVAPRIYSAPVVNNLQHPGSRPVFNLQFYGSQLRFSGRSTGASPVPSLTPQPIHH